MGFAPWGYRFVFQEDRKEIELFMALSPRSRNGARVAPERYPILRNPFGQLAVVDLLSILPSLTVNINAFKLLRIVRLGWAMRVVRVFKAFRYSRNLDLIWQVIKRTKDSLIAAYMMAAILWYQLW